MKTLEIRSMHDIPDIAFTVGNFLYARSFVEEALSLSGKSLRDLENFAELHSDCHLLNEQIVLVDSKAGFEQFESDFGSIVRSNSYDDTAGFPSTRVGGCPIRCFPSLRERDITFLHLYSDNCAIASPNENFRIESDCSEFPNSGSIVVAASKRASFPSKVRVANYCMVDSCHETTPEITLVSATRRKLMFSYRADSVNRSDFFQLICRVADICWSISPISLVVFQRN